MKAKTIKTVLRKEFDKWTKSITDDRVRKLVEKNTIITGGCIASMLLKEDVNDYDIYFTSKETILAVAEYYVAQFQQLNTNKSTLIGHTSSTETAKLDIQIIDEDDRIKLRVKNNYGEDAGVRPAAEDGFKFSDEPGDEAEDFEDVLTHTEDTSQDTLPKYRPVYLSANAITLSDKIQLVIRFYGDAETIHENYDFNHCKCYWTSKKGDLVLPAEALEALLTKELVYTGSKYPLASIIRTRKFIKRDWQINAGQYLKMCLQLNAFDLTDIRVLEDQLIGMDAMYFAQILAAIPKHKVVDNKVDSHYVIELINRFF